MSKQKQANIITWDSLQLFHNKNFYLPFMLENCNTYRSYISADNMQILTEPQTRLFLDL